MKSRADELQKESQDPDSKLGRRVGTAVILGLGVYIALALWADMEGIGAALREVPLWAPAAACALSATNYAVRFPRWQRYLTITGSSVRGWTSARIYLAGLSLTVSPGKVGEAMKSWLLKAEDGTPIARSAPIVLAERVTDLLGFLVLIAISSTTTEHAWITAATVGLSAAVLLVVSSRTVARLIIHTARRFPAPIADRATRIEETLDSARQLLAPRELPMATALAAVGWFLECVGCWILANSILPAGPGFGADEGIAELGLLPVTYA
ncbi:MAG: lysylphosphatidylglycerol synthase transmembrane domain-containing protein, partial [Planctomycetota bacterium]